MILILTSINQFSCQMMMRVLVLAVTVLVTVTESRRAAKMSSIWDVILGGETRDKQEALSTNLVTTKQRQPEEKGLLYISFFFSLKTSPHSKQETNKELFKVSDIQSTNCCFRGRKEKNADKSDGRLPLSYNRSTRPPILNIIFTFKYRILGVFPIDGDCERFLMCRSNEKTDKIKGKVYRCPKGDYLPARREKITC